MRRVLRIVGLFLFSLTTVEAAPRFARIFSDHAVLQRDKVIVVWGFDAVPGQSLALRFGDVEVAGVVTETGQWKARLPSHSASKTGRSLELIADGNQVAVINDVLVGEVWLAAGQSNMQFPVRQIVKQLPEARSWVATCQLPVIRMRRINDPVLPDREARAKDLQSGDQWVRMTPDSVINFSAVAAIYARNLYEALNVPVGIMDVSWGGKPIEPFIPRETFSKTALLRKIRHLADAGAMDELAKLPGGVIIRNPEGHPGAIFNARMFPVAPFGLRGFIWYQAESNCGKGEDPRDYRHKQKSMIEGWRIAWGNEQLPCYYVQLPSFPGASGWIRMREEQRRALAVPHTGMVVTIDVRGEGIHPPDKLSVGRRLAQLALAKTYGEGSDEAAGPSYQSQRIIGRSIRVRFDKCASGLMVGDKPSVAPAVASPDAPLRWFELADKDGRWHPAAARIEGNEVVVSAAGVSQPIAVRYACHVEPQGGNLYNRAGFPGSPFCTDLTLLPWDDHGARQ